MHPLLIVFLIFGIPAGLALVYIFLRGSSGLRRYIITRIILTVPMVFILATVVFFDDDWGIFQLYGLFFDTVLLAAGAVAFLRSRTIWGRVLFLEVAVLILVVKGPLVGWFDGRYWPAFQLIIMSFCFLLLPAVIGLLRRGVGALSSR